MQTPSQIHSTHSLQGRAGGGSVGSVGPGGLGSAFIGQAATWKLLLAELKADRVPHALMLHGPQGSGKLALAVAFAQTLLCQKPGPDGEACGQCLSCRMAAKLEHPDLHFTYPMIKGPKIKKPEEAISDFYIREWRQLLLKSPYFDMNDWLAAMKADNQQATYYVAEADNIQRKLALKSSQGGRKVMVVWLPEKMNDATANKLLKLFEEPPAQTHFIMVSQEPDKVLGTIMSRTQQIYVPPLSAEEYALAHPPREDMENYELFVMLMRLGYQRKVKDLYEWSAHMAKTGREAQKQFLAYGQHMLRENFMANFRREELVSLTPTEGAFAKNFAPFINERNVISLMTEFGRAQTDIGQNVNARMVFFDLAINIIVLLHK